MSGGLSSRTSTHLAGALTAAAGAVHLAVAGPHFADSWLLGSGFVAVGWAQLAGAAGLIWSADGRAARWMVSALNVVSIAVWGLSRTVGLPVGHPGAEAAGTADLLTVAFEVVAVAVLVVGTWPTADTRGRHTIVAISIWAVPLIGSAFAIASLADGHHGAAPEVHAHDPDAARSAHGEATRSSVDRPAATRLGADDVAPRSWPPPADGVTASASYPVEGQEGVSHEPDEAHTHAPGEGH